ncbi:MAG TPA: heme ABC exporter ATP-binding protein CcmA [Candidatus Dormibacteraeota bacterium]|nr:heme ABC exporter ATP-binding protein CcmA [Candidatus Dormibacteraeota bacterium]
MIVVRARGLVQRFGDRVALGPLDLELAAGERLAVLGGNGAGKTTLLRLLATVVRPAAGRLELFGLDATRQRERLRARLGYVGHQLGLYPALTAFENLEFFARLYGLGRGEARTALEVVGLSGAAGRRLEQLSRGQQQRLALARSVLHDPELLILDEPDASLDAEGRDLLATLFEGRSVVMATHDLALARELCGRALLLRSGRDAGHCGRLRPPEDRPRVPRAIGRWGPATEAEGTSPSAWPPAVRIGEARGVSPR